MTITEGYEKHEGFRMPELAYLNGVIMPIENAAVPVEDRGYNFGDAVYEYVASYNGRLFYLEPGPNHPKA